jgi:uncharacterized membrane protein
MTFKDFLLGRWLGHPLHPAVVHLPTSLWPAALIFDVLTHITHLGNPLVKTSFYAILIGLIATLLAIPTGIAEWSLIQRQRPVWRIAILHLAINLLATILFAINLGLRISTLQTDRAVPPVPLAFSVLGVIVLLISGYLGGLMVFNHGIGVARYSHKRWRRIAESGDANLPEP